MKKLLLVSFLTFFAFMALNAQSVMGTVVDENNDPLIGASVMVKGSATGAITDINGNYKITDIQNGDQTLEISYVGYETKNVGVTVNGDTQVNTASLASGSLLGEVVVTGVMDIVRDRRTPVAVSTITAREIQAKGGNVEFPELMKATPSIYVAGQAGGYGDSEVFTRGFDQTNTAFLLNGQPINGMEDGRMYWSNWSGMTDVANAVQVQRGLGSSKLAISSVGGTTNIIMKSTEQRKGGSISMLYGNDNYLKTTASYNTGMINDKFGLTMLLTHWQGDGWAEGTQGQGQNYFISAGYKASERSNFNFLLTGAPQWHDQNFGGSINDHYDDNGELNVKHNGNWGTLGGDYFTSRRNYYHKPVANLNWEYQVSDKSKFSTVLYGSWGRGGGSGGIGNRDNRFFTSDGQWDFDSIVAANTASHAAGGDGNEYVLRNSVNNHSWYGIVANYETQLSETLNFSVGTDLRSYRGSHFRELRDLLGAPSYSQRANARFDAREVTATFEANPWSAVNSFADLNERIAYNNDETIRYAGVFGQLEYAQDRLSGYVQTAISNQSHVRFELFNETEANEASEKVNNLGYNLKGGFSYALNDNSNFFFNTGYYQRQPFHDNIYLNFSNTVNPVTVPEKIFGIEAGYKYQTNDFALNVNVYRTSWKDRANTNSLFVGDELPNGTVLDIDAFGNTFQSQLHSGVELDFSYDVNSMIRLKGFSSIGNWVYDGTLNRAFYEDNEARTLIYEETGVDVDGVKVGGSAQTTFGLGADVKVMDGLRFDLDYLHFSKLHSRINASTNTLELPSYGLLDFGLSYNINLSNGQLLTLRTNIYNVLGTEYISRATTANEASAVEAENWNGINRSNRVTFGKTRTWNVSAKYSF